MTTPRGAPELVSAQATPETTVNEQIRRTEGGANYFTVADRVTAPPGSCASGAQYIIIATATGAFTGKENQIAQAVGANAASGWLYRTLGTLDEGVKAYVQDEDVDYKWSGSAWAAVATSGTAAALDADTDGTLAANSDSKVATQKATKTYVDTSVATAVNGLSWKQKVRVATTANGTLATAYENGDTVDGVVLATGDRILIKNQSTGAENGIYVVAASGAPARATDADSGAEMVNATVFVSEGTTNADTIWTCTTDATITLGSTSLAFATISAGSYLPLSGGTLSGDLEVPAEAYGAGWNGSNEVPTKNDVYDKIEAFAAGGTSFVAASTTEVLTGTDTSKGVTPDALAALWEKGSDITSAATISVGEGKVFHVTGSTGPITDIDPATDKAGREFILIFDSTPTLTHNASTLILPGGANIVAAAGDCAHFVSEGSDAVRCISYQKASGAAVVGGGSGVTVINPGGRLTLVSATPVLVSDQTAKTSVYYTPYITDLIPIYSGSAWSGTTFTELTMSLDTSNQLLDNLYDLFVWNDAGTVKIGAGPAWVNTATVTMTIATPAVITWTAHGLVEGDPVVFTTSGALPTGITSGTTYYVSRSPAANTFNVSTSRANAAAGTLVATSGSQSGTHTGTNGTRLRGTGAGTTELQLKNGIWTNKNSITLKNGAGGGTSGIAANTATYVGTIYCTANGQTGMAFKPSSAAGGANNILGVYNAYNRVRTYAMNRDSTATWTETSATFKSLNNNINNRISYVDGLQQSFVTTTLFNCIFTTANAALANSGVNLNNTTATPGILGRGQTGAAANTNMPTSQAETFMPTLGFNYAQAMQANTAAVGTATYIGGGNEQLMLEVDM